jgi:(p)ppGpp synthase/HD superfamily hydrolase
MATLERAIEIAIQAHKNQKDKVGQPYILHPLRVMLKGKNDPEKICGILHDVVEDSAWTFEDLKKEGFSAEVIEVLRLVTKTSEDEDYVQFIQRISQNATAVNVKLNDLEDNMDVTRFELLDEKDIKRLNKYLIARNYLRKLQTP